MKALKDLILDEMETIYDSERRIALALASLIASTPSKELKVALEPHLNETEGYVKRLEQIFAIFGVTTEAPRQVAAREKPDEPLAPCDHDHAWIAADHTLAAESPLV